MRAPHHTLVARLRTFFDMHASGVSCFGIMTAAVLSLSPSPLHVVMRERERVRDEGYDLPILSSSSLHGDLREKSL